MVHIACNNCFNTALKKAGSCCPTNSYEMQLPAEMLQSGEAGSMEPMHPASVPRIHYDQERMTF
jgi:hypothetical protein